MAVKRPCGEALPSSRVAPAWGFYSAPGGLRLKATPQVHRPRYAMLHKPFTACGLLFFIVYFRSVLLARTELAPSSSLGQN